MKKIFVAMVIAVVAGVASTGHAVVVNGERQVLLASNGKAIYNNTPTVKTAPASPENYLLKLKHEKLAEQVGLLTRKVNGTEKKIAGKVDKKYVDQKLSGFEGRLATLEGKQSEVEGSVSTLRSAHDALDKKHTATREIVNKTVKRIDGMEESISFISGGVLFLVAVVVVIGIVLALVGLRRRKATASATAAAGTGGRPTPSEDLFGASQIFSDS